MRIKDTFIEGVYIIENFKSNDNRGSFKKIFNNEAFKENNLDTQIKEVYYSVSQKNVIRGMHFQNPPYDHAKIINVIKGNVIDVVLDLRKTSATYGKFIEYNLNEKNNEAIYIPSGCAHGFKSVENETIMLYLVTTEYNKEHDNGIRWDSIGYDWKIENPIISDRDNKFIEFKDFVSPF